MTDTKPGACRSCGDRSLVDVLSLGRLPLANDFPPVGNSQEEKRYPLDLVFCRSCTLLQLREIVSPKRMFDTYSYFSSFSDTMLRHAKELAEQTIRERKLGKDSFVIEAASNDGYLLRNFKESGIPVMGIEPASNVAAVSVREHGIPTQVEYFGSDSAKRWSGRADVFFGLNVLAHVPTLNDFAAGIASVMKDDGVAIIEVPYVREMMDRSEFDTIYHEHVFYFSLHSLVSLFHRHGLHVQRAERISIHGGSLRVTLHKKDRGREVQALLDEESAAGIRDEQVYLQFRDRVEGVRNSLIELVRSLRQQGAKVAGYGAAAKGTILLNTCGLDSRSIDFVADRSPHKQGRTVPGCRIPIVPPEALLERRPDYVLLLAWNLADEIMSQQKAYHDQGGRFIVPLPVAKVL